MLWNFVQYTILCDKTQMLKNLSFGQSKRYKKHYFISRSPTHHSFTFNSQFLYEIKHMVYLSKTACGIFHFWFRLVFIKLYFSLLLSSNF